MLKDGQRDRQRDRQSDSLRDHMGVSTVSQCRIQHEC